MSHHHDHHHHHGHDHHHHHHGHDHGSAHSDHQEPPDHSSIPAPETPSEREKMVKMVSHWIHHNEEHAGSYREWARRARGAGLGEAALLLEEIAVETQRLTGSFERVKALLEKNP